MSQVLRLYKFYLKKLLKSWYFWVSLGLFWFFFIIWPLISFYTSKQRLYDGLGGFRQINYKEFIGNVLTNVLNNISYLTGENKINSNYPIFSTIWTLFLSVWWMGLIGMFFLANPAISSLVGKPKEDGEDKTVLTTASPIQRNDIVLAKMGAFFTFFLVINLVGVVLPFFAYYCWTGSNQGIFSAQFAFSFLALAGLVFPLLFFLFIYSILFFMHMVFSGLIVSLFAALLFAIPWIWTMVWMIKKAKIEHGGEVTAFFRFLDKGKDLMLTKPLFVIPLCLGIGALFFYLYLNVFTKKDFN